jgi:hypothetical protein
VGGLSFTSEHFIPADTSLKLEFGILSRYLVTVGKVVWARALPHSTKTQLGIYFTEINPGEKNYLKDFIDIHSEKL